MSKFIYSIYNINHNYKLIKTFVLFLLMINTSLFSMYANENETSQYVFPAFYKSIIIMKVGKQEAKINYNIVTEEMVFDQNGKYLAIANIESVDTVIIQNRKFLPVGKVFYELLVSGIVTLYFQHVGKLIENKQESTVLGTSSQSSSDISYTKLNRPEGIYNLKLSKDYSVVNESAFKIFYKGELKTFNNKRQFLKIFPEKTTLLEQFIKSNNIDINKMDQMTKLINYCNEIYK